MNMPRLAQDLRTLFTGDFDTRTDVVNALRGIAVRFESQGLHSQGHAPTADRYIAHAEKFNKMADAIEGAV